MESVDQALECFQLAMTLLSGDTRPERLVTLVFENKINGESFVSLLFNYISLPSYSSSVEYFEIGSLEFQMANETDQLLNHLKIYSLKCLTKFVSICSYDTKSEEPVAEDAKMISKMCAETIVQERGMDILLDILSGKGFYDNKDAGKIGEDDVRIAATECLFFFVVKNEVGRLAMLLQKGVSILLKTIERDTNELVRSYCCAILKEFSSGYPEELLKDNALDICARVLNNDSSPEIRTLCAEILESLFRKEESCAKIVSYPELCQVLNDRLTTETSREVLEATCKLTETLFNTERENKVQYIEAHREFIAKGYWRSFIRVLKQCSVRPASLAVRSFRYLLQSAPSEENLSRQVVNHFQSLSVLLKAALEQTKTANSGKQNSSNNIAHKLLKVEISIVLALLFAQSPQSRRQVHTELIPFPLWMSTLRGALLKHLTYAEVDYFSDMKLVDERGRDLCAEFRALSMDTLDTNVLKGIFSEQDIYEGSRDETSAIFTKKPSGKIYHFILSYIIHDTLSNEDETGNTSPRTPGKATNNATEPPYITAAQTPNSTKNKDNNVSVGDDSFANQFSHVIPPSTGKKNVPEQSPYPSQINTPVVALTPIEKPQSATPKKQSEISALRKVVSKSSESFSLQKRQFENTVFLCKRLGEWYESKEMKIKRQQAQDEYIKAHRLAANISGYRNIPDGYINAKDGLVLRYRQSESPQKLYKSWTDEDVKTTDAFTFEIPFDDFTVERIERIIVLLMKHTKYIKKAFIICPKAPNSKGRRSFLMDMNTNIMPKTYNILSELLMMMKEYGPENIKMPIYLWKGKERKDSSLTQYNILEIMEFVKIHIANYFQGDYDRDDNINFNNSMADNILQTIAEHNDD